MINYPNLISEDEHVNAKFKHKNRDFHVDINGSDIFKNILAKLRYFS